MANEILALAEHRQGTLKKSAHEVVTAARSLASPLSGRVVAVVLSNGDVEGIEGLGRFGAEEVVHVNDAAFEGSVADAAAATLCRLARERSARAVLLPASALGKDVAPRLSARLDTPLLSDCVGLEVDGDAVVARRPVFAGKARWTVRVSVSPFLATLRPNVFTPSPIEDAAPATVTSGAAAPLEGPLPERTEVLEPESARRVELTEAEVIVSGGRGMGGPEHFHLVEELAEALGAAVGASRAVVDAGWRPHGEQVGQTGKTVAPNLYIACGISGAIQHLAGMASSRVIVAINKDPEAPIFKVADYGIVGDVHEVLPALRQEIARQRG